MKSQHSPHDFQCNSDEVELTRIGIRPAQN